MYTGLKYSKIYNQHMNVAAITDNYILYTILLSLLPPVANNLRRRLQAKSVLDGPVVRRRHGWQRGTIYYQARRR